MSLTVAHIGVCHGEMVKCDVNEDNDDKCMRVVWHCGCVSLTITPIGVCHVEILLVSALSPVNHRGLHQG